MFMSFIQSNMLFVAVKTKTKWPDIGAMTVKSYSNAFKT